MSYFFFKKNIFLAEIRKAYHQLYQIICFDRVMNLFLFCVMYFVKKGSFLAKTAVSRRPYGFSIVFPFVIYLFS